MMLHSFRHFRFGGAAPVVLCDALAGVNDNATDDRDMETDRERYEKH